jgi:transposase-like protein
MDTLPPFTPAQEQVLALISAGSTISEAARSAGVHRNTVHHWVRLAPSFQLALTRARDWKAEFWREQAGQLAPAALDTVRALMTGPTIPAGVRLKAAQFILSLAMTPPPPTPQPAPAEPVHNSAQSPAPSESIETVHNSAQSPAPSESTETVHNSAQSLAQSATTDPLHNSAQSPARSVRPADPHPTLRAPSRHSVF